MAAAAAVAAATAAGPPTWTYEVTITNLTAGQPFTPPLLAAHRGAADVFTVGQPASFGVKEIAENGNLGPLIAALGGSTHVLGTAVGGAPVVSEGLPGSGAGPVEMTLTLETRPGARFLSWVSMLICTNDGFTGVDSLLLPAVVGRSVTVHTNGYDAGTETNTEDFADMVPPCQGLVGVTSSDPGTGTSDPGLAEGGVISHHAGITGGTDLLPGTHGWGDPVAALTVERVG